MKPSYLALLIVFNLFWAATYSTFKALSAHLDAGGIVTLRFLLASLALAAAWPVLKGQTPRGADLFRNAVMGVVVFCIGPRLQVAGVHLGQAGDASVLVALEPLIASVAAAVFLRESIRPLRWMGFGFGVLGVVLLAQVWRTDFRLPGLAANTLFVSSFICETAYSIMGKRLIERAGLLKVLAIALAAGTVANLLWDGSATLTAAWTLPLSAWLLLGYLGLVCTAAGYAFWFVVIRVVPVNVAAVTIFIQPVAGVIIAVVWLNESLHWGQLWGSLAILIGLALGLQRRQAARN